MMLNSCSSAPYYLGEYGTILHKLCWERVTVSNAFNRSRDIKSFHCVTSFVCCSARQWGGAGERQAVLLPASRGHSQSAQTVLCSLYILYMYIYTHTHTYKGNKKQDQNLHVAKKNFNQIREIIGWCKFPKTKGCLSSVGRS